MSLRRKAFFILVSFIVAAALCISGVTSLVIYRSFRQLEIENTQRNVNRVLEAINENLSQLASKNSDWAFWDDSYNFMETKDETFLETNTPNTAFEALDINFLVFLDNQNQIVFAKAYNLNEKREDSLPSDFPLDIASGAKGIIIVGGQPALVSSQPILTSEGEGPARGRLVFGHYLDEDLLVRFEEITGLSVKLFDLNAPDLPDYIQAHHSQTSQTEDIYVYPLDRQLVSGHTHLTDVNGKEVLIIEIELERSIYRQGLQSLTYLVISVLFTSLIAGIAIVLSLEKVILSRIFQLRLETADIAEHANFSRRVSVLGRDEISSLAETTNQMLGQLERLEQETETKNVELSLRVKEVQEKNQDLEGTKKAMLNLLEDEKELEARLKKEKDMATAIISSMGEGLLVIDRNYRISLMNPVAEKLLGVSASQALGQEWSKVVKTFVSDTEMPFNSRTAVKTLRSGEIIITKLEDNHYYKTASAEAFPVVSITAPIIADSTVVGAVKVFRDATEEKEAKDIIERKVVERTIELYQEKAKLTSSINSLTLGFLIIDATGTVVLTNPALTKILNLDVKNLTLEAVQTKLGAALDLIGQCDKCIKEAKAQEIKEVIWGNKFLKIFLAPVVTTKIHQQVIGAVVTIEDITEAKVLDRSKEEFFSIASHELRTPLTAIRGNTALIQEHYLDKFKADSDFAEMISDMHDSAVRLIEIVNDFLKLSRLEQGRIVFKKENLDLTTVVKEMIDEVKNLAKQKNLTVKFKKPDKPVPLTLTDKERVEEVLSNLIGNAIKYTDTGTITLEIKNEDKFNCVYITDTGRGISSENQSLLFRKFQQAGDSLYTRDTTKGTGLGLYISKLIISGMDGDIWLVDSRVGKGSTFAFKLPAAENS
ncbi:hypothetical protein A3A66_00025 [Microgenomates group bacterium RIFCSPLOWO2_01_FULL_46_13]|nr:MAG: hypothetical protein A2783_02680 [Microgenomates group bacterium RIFCSPHIGHO2_01_FULL_45_11]OGV95205.1 MAG: hypothetical protein A3A66_00025 [Microgenomates group bacterium RIFCSPLOWO2_01_FULL_46_13]